MTRVITGLDQGTATSRNRILREGAVILANPLTLTWRDLQEYADFNRDFLAAVQMRLRPARARMKQRPVLSCPRSTAIMICSVPGERPRDLPRVEKVTELLPSKGCGPC